MNLVISFLSFFSFSHKEADWKEQVEDREQNHSGYMKETKKKVLLCSAGNNEN